MCPNYLKAFTVPTFYLYVLNEFFLFQALGEMESVKNPDKKGLVTCEMVIDD